jgi:hypothetical protein
MDRANVQKQRSLGKRSRRPRHEPAKVWHNPDVVTTPGRSDSKNGSRNGSKASMGSNGASAASPAADSTASRPMRRAAGATAQAASRPQGGTETAMAPAARPQRIVTKASGPTDPKALERDRLLARLAGAEGRPAISRAADAILAAGFELPADDQAIQLQLLEHSKEEHVEAALERLAEILSSEPCKRQTVLESRLRRLEAYADEPTTRNAARRLWRQVTGRAAADEA